MAIFHTHQGSSALSDFRKKRLAQKIGVENIDANYVHYIALNESLTPEERSSLEGLLTYDQVPQPAKTAPSTGRKYTFYVAPRTGTISPWSSKSTSIAHVCDFRKVRRIERGIVLVITSNKEIDHARPQFADELHDRMTENLTSSPPDLDSMFAEGSPAPLRLIDLGSDPHHALRAANIELGLALDDSEIEYLVEAYGPGGLNRPPTDVELFMFGQVNSEHCRHKIFNASWTIDGESKPNSLFSMIKETHKQNPQGTVSAYSDNAAVIEGPIGSHFSPDWTTNEWRQDKETVDYLIKVETHNHPTAVSPFPGAATGSGGEIRDEGAVGRGSRPKAGLCGFSVSDLCIPDFPLPWELSDVGKPSHISSSLDIMLAGPIGSSSFSNEFGRPVITGYLRTLLTRVPTGGGRSQLRGYHKPIMIAGGLGSVRKQLGVKDASIIDSGDFAVVLGGPSMLIGLGGGAASSISSGEGSIELDFASVQRANAEMQRRAQEVINTCSSMGATSPILFIHDVGAGGLSNALPELVHDAGGFGATFELRDIDNADKGLSPMEIWCNEAQERYVMIIAKDRMDIFKAIANRERCSFSIVGKTTGAKRGSDQAENRLILQDRVAPRDQSHPIDLPMSVLFGKVPKKSMVAESVKPQLPPFDSSLEMYLPNLAASDILHEVVSRVLALPTVASKSYLITIGDRSVGGLISRDQMCGPWQVPVADCGVVATSLTTGVRTGEAFAIGEKPNIALISPASSVRMALAESLTNVSAADLAGGLRRIKLSANWMAQASSSSEAANLYEGVKALSELCIELGISVPVGKDSMSMKMSWKDQESQEAREVTAPLSLVVSIFAPVGDIRKTWTPTLKRIEDVGETILMFVDLGMGKKALGGSALTQVFNQVGDAAPDIRDVQILRDFSDALAKLRESGIILAYHDRSDGGLFTTLVEMMFAGRSGVEVMLDRICPTTNAKDVIETLFNEELGVVMQVRKSDEIEFSRAFANCGPPQGLINRIGRVAETKKQELSIYQGGELIYRASRTYLQQRWASSSYAMARLRDNPASVDSEFTAIRDNLNPGLSYNLTFDPSSNIMPKLGSLLNAFSIGKKPRVAILREQGVNGAAEMAYAFSTAGFVAVDVHMGDIISGKTSLDSFVGLAAVGGFSYGDCLAAGRGWAQGVLLHPKTRAEFQSFFERPNTFTLGVCNGCQFLSHIKQLIPGFSSCPQFTANLSEQYEARFVEVEIVDNPGKPSVFFYEMGGSKLPVSTAHAEGRATFEGPDGPHRLLNDGLVAVRFVDNYLRPTEQYPFNPNGSPLGITGCRSEDGRVLALMPHVERNILAGTGSWISDSIAKKCVDHGPWLRVFESARRWVG